jgi:hypothetical protein
LQQDFAQQSPDFDILWHISGFCASGADCAWAPVLAIPEQHCIAAFFPLQQHLAEH